MKKSLFVPFRVIRFRRLRWAGHVAGMEERGSAFRISVHLQGRPLGRPGRRREDKAFRKAWA
jgi:hypothetical protein